MTLRRHHLLHLAVAIAIAIGFLLFDYVPYWLSAIWVLATFVLGFAAVAASWKMAIKGSEDMDSKHPSR